MPTIEFQGKQIGFDDDGYMVDPRDWSEKLAERMAKEDGILLTEEHWEIIKFVREYYLKFQLSPRIKILVNEVRKAFGDQKGNTKYLYELFPNGPAKMSNRYAGNPQPFG